MEVRADSLYHAHRTAGFDVPQGERVPRDEYHRLRSSLSALNTTRRVAPESAATAAHMDE